MSKAELRPFVGIALIPTHSQSNVLIMLMLWERGSAVVTIACVCVFIGQTTLMPQAGDKNCGCSFRVHRNDDPGTLVWAQELWL